MKYVLLVMFVLFAVQPLLVRARIGGYELKLSHAALRADEIISQSRLVE